jgi:hypothetical protein
MRSKGNAPTAAQKEWRELVRGVGSVVSRGDAVIHHPIGATGKHRKIAIGHWWVIPLTDDEHKALHAGETFGYESRKEFEKSAFQEALMQIAHSKGITIATQIELAIMDYHL